MTKDQYKKLQDIYSAFRIADKIVVPEINMSSYTHDDVVKTDAAFTKYYEMIGDICNAVGKLLDEIEVEENK